MVEINGVTALEQFREKVGSRVGVLEEEIAPGIICFSIIKGVSTGEMYDTVWMREVRGITFCARTGSIISRPLHKFFNINEREETQLKKLDWSKIVRVMDKRDGSMIHAVKTTSIQNEPYSSFRLKSKKTFESDIAIDATKFEEDPLNKNIKAFIEAATQRDLTPIFEFTSAASRIVLGYGEKQTLTLLHIRDNITGAYLNQKELDSWAELFSLTLVENSTEFNSFEEYIAAAKTREGIEGWVFQDDTGDMFKVKTDWYMARHRAMTFFRERDIAELILKEQLDDVKAMLVGDGIDIEVIEKIEEKFNRIMSSLISSVEEHYKENKHLAPRDIAAKVVTLPMSKLIMSRYNNKPVDYTTYFQRKILKQQFGLEKLDYSK